MENVLKAAVGCLIAIGATAAWEDEPRSVALTNEQLQAVSGGIIWGKCEATGKNCKNCRAAVGGWWQKCDAEGPPEIKCNREGDGQCSVTMPECPGTCWHYSNAACNEGEQVATSNTTISQCKPIE